MPPSSRPVVALDVDGVVNADTGGQVHTVVVDPADQPESPFVRRIVGEPGTVTLHIDPAIGPWITALRAHADVVWATTWEHAANLHIAPLLGIDPLPVAVSVAEHPPRFGYAKNRDAIGWKAEVLTDLYPGRPLVWVDDGAWGYWDPEASEDPERVWWDWRYTDDPRSAAPSLIVTPQVAVGLTASERARVGLFVAAPFDFPVLAAPVWID